MRYQKRVLDIELDDLFDQLPAIAIDGPKLVGKTTTAMQRAASALPLDDTGLRLAVGADPAQVLSRRRPLLLDEWQQVPAVWDVVRRAVDDNPEGGQFLLVGSASPAAGATAHSGAGRVARLRMRPMTLAERGLEAPAVSLNSLLGGARPALEGSSDLRLADYAEEIIQSGFPTIRRLAGRALKVQLDSYIRNAVDRDIPELGADVRKPDALLSWLRAYAAATSGTASYSQILDAATGGEAEKPSRSTATIYRDLLTRIWLLDPVPSWAPHGSLMTRLGQAPKHHLADPALAARLLGATPGSLLDGAGAPAPGAAATLLSSLFESLATLCVRVYAQAADATVGHLRTRNGDHEVDLVVIRDDGRVVAIEVKLAAAVTDSDVKHLAWLREQLGDQLLDSLVLYTGQLAYRRPDGVGVVPLALLGP